MIRLNRYPDEKEIDLKASLCTMASLPIEFYVAKTGTSIFIKSVVRNYKDYDFYATRALLYGFYAEDELRHEFGGAFVDADDPELKNLDFQIVKRPYVSNAIHGMGLQTYALKIGKKLPKATLSFLMSFYVNQCEEDPVVFLEKALFGEEGNIAASFAKKDEKIFIRLDVLATFNDEKMQEAMKWTLRLLHYLTKHFPFSPVPNVNEKNHHRDVPEFSIANLEIDVETEKRTNPLFRQYLGEKIHALSIFDVGAKWEAISPSKKALECIDITRKVRLEGEHACHA